jgi:hypothetical protein
LSYVKIPTEARSGATPSNRINSPAHTSQKQLLHQWGKFGSATESHNEKLWFGGAVSHAKRSLCHLSSYKANQTFKQQQILFYQGQPVLKEVYFFL